MYSFLILCADFHVARMQIRLSLSWPHNIKAGLPCERMGEWKHSSTYQYSYMRNYMEVSGKLQAAVALPSKKAPLVSKVTQCRSECLEEKHLLPAPAKEPRLKGRPSRSVVTTPTSSPRFVCDTHVICSVRNAIISATMYLH